MNIFPIIVYALDDKDIVIFNNVEEFNNGTIEAEDVFNKNYLVYDLQGNLLKLTTDLRENTHKLFKICFFTYHGTGHINLKINSSHNNQSSKLKSHLLEYFKLYHKLHFNSNTALDTLIKKLMNMQ